MTDNQIIISSKNIKWVVIIIAVIGLVGIAAIVSVRADVVVQAVSSQVAAVVQGVNPVHGVVTVVNGVPVVGVSCVHEVTL